MHADKTIIQTMRYLSCHQCNISTRTKFHTQTMLLLDVNKYTISQYLSALECSIHICFRSLLRFLSSARQNTYTSKHNTFAITPAFLHVLRQFISIIFHPFTDFTLARFIPLHLLKTLCSASCIFDRFANIKINLHIIGIILSVNRRIAITLGSPPRHRRRLPLVVDFLVVGLVRLQQASLFIVIGVCILKRIGVFNHYLV
mmetsp:Transcript_10769/g.17341  ORF Transcript_10769/g.17341 Transcript_10769/m.17341 type:complete len:201 (-) Transcript_10769:651-1253(-)